MTVDVSVSAPAGARPGTLFRPGDVAVAAYQRVPVSDYPLPARPASLAALPAVPAGVGWDARRAGGGSGTTRTVYVNGTTGLRVITIAPGAVRVTVAGKLVGLAEAWDWSQDSFELGLNVATLRAAGVEINAGEGIDVTVTAGRFTVPAWTAEVR